MLAIPRWKFWLIISTCLMGLLFALPNVSTQAMLSLMPSWLQNKINLAGASRHLVSTTEIIITYGTSKYKMYYGFVSFILMPTS